jgi:hypothetical protein
MEGYAARLRPMRLRGARGAFIFHAGDEREGSVSETITKKGRLLLKRHLLHRGIYVRIATKMRVDASYVSRVASGERTSAKVERAVIVGLERIDAL